METLYFPRNLRGAGRGPCCLPPQCGARVQSIIPLSARARWGGVKGRGGGAMGAGRWGDGGGAMGRWGGARRRSLSSHSERMTSWFCVMKMTEVWSSSGRGNQRVWSSNRLTNSPVRRGAAHT